MNSIKKVIALVFLSFTITANCMVNTLPELICDMQKYKTTNARFHAGHVFEHSVWVARSSINLLNSMWKTKCDCEVAMKNIILASLFHDIGKCGDMVYSFNEKKEHPQIGFEYLIGKRAYMISENESYNFDSLYHQLNLDDDSRAFIAIVAGMHHHLGALMRGLNNNDDNCFHKALHDLDAFIYESGYMGGNIARNSKAYKKLIKYIILISVADVISAQVVPYNENHEVIDNITGICLREHANNRCLDLSDGMNGYSYFKYEIVGINARINLLSMCK